MLGICIIFHSYLKGIKRHKLNILLSGICSTFLSREQLEYSLNFTSGILRLCILLSRIYFVPCRFTWVQWVCNKLIISCLFCLWFCLYCLLYFFSNVKSNTSCVKSGLDTTIPRRILLIYERNLLCVYQLPTLTILNS